MMKKLILILFILVSVNSKGAIYQISVWNGYSQFLPPNNITIQLGDTIQWIPLDPPTMSHTITSDNIPWSAVPFNQIWQLPADTFFQYIPQVIGLYQYVCTPHILNGMIGEFTVVNGTTSQKTYVPDDNFEQALINLGYDTVLDDSVITVNINLLNTLDVSFQNISDLTGIEDFSALTSLFCINNQLDSLDVSNNTSLDSLVCINNQLTSLDVSQNTVLTVFACDINQLTSLDVSANTSLISLFCSDNQLTNLDVSQNTALTTLNCVSNQLTSLNLNTNTSLTNLYCYDNSLANLNVNTNTDLILLKCYNNLLTSLDVSNNIALTQLECNDNQLTSLDARNGINISWSFIAMNNPNLSCIDVDDANWSTTNWTVTNGSIDAQQYFSTNCSITQIQEQTTNKELLKVTDLFGRETKGTNQTLFYIFDDGTVEKKIIIE